MSLLERVSMEERLEEEEEEEEEEVEEEEEEEEKNLNHRLVNSVQL